MLQPRPITSTLLGLEVHKLSAPTPGSHVGYRPRKRCRREAPFPGRANVTVSLNKKRSSVPPLLQEGGSGGIWQSPYLSIYCQLTESRLDFRQLNTNGGNYVCENPQMAPSLRRRFYRLEGDLLTLTLKLGPAKVLDLTLDLIKDDPPTTKVKSVKSRKAF